VLVAEAAFPAALLVLASVLKAGDVGLRYSLDHATRELLFVPAAPLARVRAKAYVDVLTHRLAEGVAAVVLLTVTVGWLEPLDTAWLVLALVAVWLVATVSAQRRYVEALQRRFNERAIDDGMALDVTEVGTLEMLIEALGSAESGHVLRALDLLASNQRGRLIPPLLLHHDDARVRLRTLEILRAEGRRDALALIEKCLGDDDGDVRAEAVQTLAVLLGAGGPDLMRSRLDDPDPRVRAAAVACLASFGDERDRTHAGLVVAHMACEDDPAARVQAAQALAQSPDQLFRGELVRLLYDRDWLVVRAALDAVRVRVERDGWNPIYVPILVSLLRHRRVKHEAREALVACGVDVVPALRHFLTDRGEQLWVRRALPKTLARFASQAALDALFAGLEGCDDRLFRRKSIEALARCPKLAAADRRLERVVHDECRQSLAALLDLLAVSAQGAFELSGPQLVWRESPTLLQRLLDERRRDHLENALRLVALRVEGAEAARAREHLLGEDASRRMQAIELLDNLTPAPLRRPLMVVIDDLDAGERRALAERVFGLPQRGADEVWRELLAADDQQDIAEGAAWLASAAIAEVSARELRSLYPLVRRLAERGAGVARETARWALESVTLATAPPLRIAPLSAGEAASRRGAP
jgi:HEAT repeat protein